MDASGLVTVTKTKSNNGKAVRETAIPRVNPRVNTSTDGKAARETHDRSRRGKATANPRVNTNNALANRAFAATDVSSAVTARVSASATETASAAVRPDGLDATLSRGSVALTFVVCASVALCSRLPRDADHAFALLFAVCVLFAGLPPVLAVLERARPRAFAAASALLAAAGWLVLTAHSPVIGHCFAAALAGVVCVAPAVFARQQGGHLKREYEGPWDYDDEGEAGRENI